MKNELSPLSSPLRCLMYVLFGVAVLHALSCFLFSPRSDWFQTERANGMLLFALAAGAAALPRFEQRRWAIFWRACALMVGLFVWPTCWQYQVGDGGLLEQCDRFSGSCHSTGLFVYDRLTGDTETFVGKQYP